MTDIDDALARQTLLAALIPLLRGYLKFDNSGDLPEAFSARVVAATGFKGGDTGHGGKLAIRFEFDQGVGDNEIRHTVDRTAECETIDLVSRGDIEQAGLICALVGLLADVLPVYSAADAVLPVMSCIECGEIVDRRNAEGRSQWSCPRCGKINDVGASGT
jgi:hypothetical protein